jgi:hypothetical protein
VTAAFTKAALTGATTLAGAYLATFYSAEAFLLAASTEAFLAFSFLYSPNILVYSVKAFLEFYHLSTLDFF